MFSNCDFAGFVLARPYLDEDAAASGLVYPAGNFPGGAACLQPAKPVGRIVSNSISVTRSNRGCRSDTVTLPEAVGGHAAIDRIKSYTAQGTYETSVSRMRGTFQAWGKEPNMNSNEIVNHVNQQTYARSEVLKSYYHWDFLMPPEQAVLERLLPLIKDKMLLDIGIGAGRTTKFLLEISRDYTGIDYTPSFVEIVRKKHEDANILCCDARDLGIFRESTFDFILFSFNGIDSVVHEDRIRVLKEIYRVLKPGGFFMFSSHNRNYIRFNKIPWQLKIPFSLAELRSHLTLLYHLPRHFSMKRHEVYADEYAIINDSAHDFSLLLYYIGVSNQIKQLQNIGFLSVEAYDIEGSQVSSDTTSPWIHYLANK